MAIMLKRGNNEMLTGLRGADGQVRCKDQSQDRALHVLALQLSQGQEPN